MYTVASQNGRGTRCNPDASESVGIHLVLLNETLALLVHIDTAMLAMVDLVVPDYWITVCTYL